MRAALDDAGVAVPADSPAPRPSGRQGRGAQRAIIEDDARSVQAFRDKWAPRQDAVTHARHANMLRVILGEAVEQKRFFDQMLEGPRGRARPAHGGRDHRRRRAAGPMGGVARQVAIALGSNLGDRRAHLANAVDALAEVLDGLRVSTFVETDPVGTPDPQPPYLNGAAVGQSSLPARRPARRGCWPSSDAAGRERPYRDAPRTLDLDLILCGDDVVERAGPARAAPAVPGARVRARAAGRDRAGPAGPGDRADGRALLDSRAWSA